MVCSIMWAVFLGVPAAVLISHDIWHRTPWQLDTFLFTWVYFCVTFAPLVAVLAS